MPVILVWSLNTGHKQTLSWKLFNQHQSVPSAQSHVCFTSCSWLIIFIINHPPTWNTHTHNPHFREILSICYWNLVLTNPILHSMPGLSWVIYPVSFFSVKSTCFNTSSTGRFLETDIFYASITQYLKLCKSFYYMENFADKFPFWDKQV